MKDQFEIRQTITVFDFYKGALRLWFQNKKLRLFIFLPAVAVLVFGMLSVLLSPKPGKASISLVSQVLFLFVFTTCFYLVGFFIILVVMRIARPGHFKNTVYTFNHWGMHKKAGAAEYSRPWKNFTKWKETKSFFLLYIAGNDAHIISKKAIDEKDLEDFRKFLDDRITQF